MFQWKRFQFFEQELVKEGGSSDNPHQIIQKLDINCCTSGRGNLIFGDTSGFVNVVDRDFKVYSFQAFRFSVTHAEQLKQANILVAIGDDDDAISPTLKVWNLDKADKSGNPLCLRSIKIQPPVGAVVPVTCLAVLEDLSQVAIGLCNGVVLLMRDLGHERAPKLVPLSNPSYSPITGLGFSDDGKDRTTLFAATPDSTVAYHTSLQRTPTEVLDDRGCELGRAVISDTHDLCIGRKEAVYFYEPEGRGPCFAFEGEKKMLSWFRGYLIVVSQQEVASGPKQDVFTIYDLKNKFIAYTTTFTNISYIVSEWGSIFVLTRDGLLYQVQEKDTQTKLETLFKKNLYSVAIDLAHSQQYDYNSITDIFRKYGDHLYSKGDYDGAMRQYLRTISRLEPSYVIRKFLDAQRIHNLTSYLQALHEQGLANADHTTLLFNCYTKLKDVQKLDEFIKAGSNLKFEVKTAIKVCRQAGYFEHALYLAKRHNHHEQALKIIVEDLKDYQNALTYIATLNFFECEKVLKKYGKNLVSCMPEQTTNLLMDLCTNYKPKGTKEATESFAQPRPKANAEEFIHVFVGQEEWLAKFLEFIVQQGLATNLVYNTLLEIYLRDDVGDKVPVMARTERLNRAIALLNDPRAQFDEDHALVLCQMHDFKAGILVVYEHLKLYHEIVDFHMENNDYEQVISSCKKYGPMDPDLWIEALTYFALRDDDCQHEIGEVLNNIDRENLLPPLPIIQILSQKPTTQLVVVKDYIVRRLSQENQLIAEDQRCINNYREETEKMKKEFEELRSGAKIFQLHKCTACTGPLDLPSVHFLCMHSFHLRCLGEYDKECPVCVRNNRKILEIKKSLEENSEQHEAFFRELDAASDGFEVVAKYFGRGIFSHMPSVNDQPPVPPQ